MLRVPAGRKAGRVWSLVFVLLIGALVGAATMTARADVVTVSNDVQRTGWDPNESALTSGR